MATDEALQRDIDTLEAAVANLDLALPVIEEAPPGTFTDETLSNFRDVARDFLRMVGQAMDPKGPGRCWWCRKPISTSEPTVSHGPGPHRMAHEWCADEWRRVHGLPAREPTTV